MALAVVTGTSSGIGLATAVALARSGHIVAATMRNLERGGDIRKIAADEELPIHLAKIDVDDDDSSSGRQGVVTVLQFKSDIAVSMDAVVDEQVDLAEFRKQPGKAPPA